MRCFKFVIPDGDWRVYPTAPRVSVSGCAAIVFAEDQAKATALLREAIGTTPAWAEVATVSEIDLAVAQVALRVQT